MTLATIGIDRYDAICRAPVRRITCQKTAHYNTFIWLFVCFTAVPGGAGHLLTAMQGKHVCASPGRAFDQNAHTGKYVMLAVVTLWIVPSLCIKFNRFYGIVKYVREYSSHLRSVLGTSSVKQEVKLTKICVTMMITYANLWITFAIMVMLRNKFSSVSVHCAYPWAHSLAYYSFAVVPIKYMILDKRCLTHVYRKFMRKSRSKISAEDGSSQMKSFAKDFSTVHSQPSKGKKQWRMHHTSIEAKTVVSNVVASEI